MRLVIWVPYFVFRVITHQKVFLRNYGIWSGVAMVSGITTSIILETLILWKQLGPKEAFRTAIGMSLISMILMELAMNLADYGMMGEPAITFQVLPFTLGAGFLAAWPYNFWRLKKHGKCCH